MQEYAKEIKPVFISDDKVTPMELKGAIRKGYREATPAEIALMYVYGNYLQTDLNHGFILELHEKVAVRASIKGLHESYGPHRIKDDGSFIPMADTAKFNKLPSERRALLIPGESM